MLSHSVILEVLSSHICLVVTAVLDNVYVDGMTVGMGVRVGGKLIGGEEVKELRG